MSATVNSATSSSPAPASGKGSGTGRGADVAKLYADRPHATVGRIVTAVVIVALIVWSTTGIEASGAKADSGWTVVSSILNGLVHPAPQLLFNLTPQGVPYLLVETIAIAFMGTVVGAVIAVPLAFLAATNLMPKPIAWIANFVIMAIRTVPVFVYGIMFVRVTGPGAFAGLMTMSLCSVGMVSKMFIEAIEDLDRGVIESLSAMGLNRWQQIRFGVLPQMMASFLSTAIYRFDMNLRDATILGLVGAGGIGAPLIFAMNSYRWNEAASILWGLVVLILVVEFCSTKIRNKLARG
ncbi:phosphonate ABC transporter permease [Bifidobacterium sp. DSM 109958]|uniref:Phosphonate ABC transporter permease n=1 Tax=Bifidobacterium moraviense TaxID=2675323 RepID=A0A7Y0F370_9BIFI|nr:phosphonate ABC transporter, permease protein PhnE [Bifidobacterium sp. DSM 109958]NMN01201.1 phosphonate ABC transporter permease [Bifidobacterium sp. DSM 109958]